jgi:hypothetical protein
MKNFIGILEYDNSVTDPVIAWDNVRVLSNQFHTLTSLSPSFIIVSPANRDVLENGEKEGYFHRREDIADDRKRQLFSSLVAYDMKRIGVLGQKWIVFVSDFVDPSSIVIGASISASEYARCYDCAVGKLSQ